MVRLPGGSFRAGDDRFYPEEGPVHDAEVGPMWVDEHPVTNAEFRRFVKATGHVTVAEHEPDPADFDGADEELLVPGSLVFTPTTGPGAAGRLDPLVAVRPRAPTGGIPLGPAAPWTGSTGTRWCTSASRTRAAYADVGRQVPARPRRSGSTPPAAGSSGRPSPGATTSRPRGKVMANTWHGRFPWENLRPHGSHRHRRRSGSSRATASACTTSPATSGSGRVSRWTRRPLPDVDARATRRARPQLLRTLGSCCRRGERAARGATGGSPRAARTCARRRTACATARPPGRATRCAAAPGTSASAASSATSPTPATPPRVRPFRRRRTRLGGGSDAERECAVATKAGQHQR